MTEDRIVRLCYAGAVGWLSVSAYGGKGFPIGLAIVFTANVIGAVFGTADS